MNVEKKDISKWCKGLRSGEYTQTRGTLQNSEGYCCLGLACKLFIYENNTHKNHQGFIFGITPQAQQYSPKWLKAINDDFYDRAGEHLMDLNDRDRLTFDEIADCLEAVYIHEVWG